MGAGSSKPEDASKHVFSSGTPVQFSQELVDSLQASSETNSTRAKTLEIHIAERVAAELEKIQQRETATLDDLRAKLSTTSTTAEDPSDSTPQSTLSSKIKSAAADALPNNLIPPSSSSPQSQDDKPTPRKAQAQAQAPSSQKVQDEIARLKRTLAERKVLTDLPPDVERARAAVVSCLRRNDRRPLDCWQEVEVFRGAVRKMEERFVADVL